MPLSNVLPYLLNQEDQDRIGKMVFEEDFNQHTLNRSVWDIGYVGNVYPIRNYNVVTYNDGNVERTVLRMWPVYDKGLDSTLEETINGFYRREISTGNMGFRQQYGYFEVCAKVNRSKGLWPQFMLTHPNGQFIKFMETFGEAPFTDGEYNPIDYRVTNYGSDGVTKLSDCVPSLIRRLDTGFHTFGCEWAPEYVKYFFDGKLVATHWHGFHLMSEMMISLRLWFGGLLEDPDTLATAQGQDNAIEIDHVRTWLPKFNGRCTGPAAGTGDGTLVLDGDQPEAPTASVVPYVSLSGYQSIYSLASATISAPPVRVDQGDLIVVVVRYNGPAAAETITDTLGNVYTAGTRSESGTAFSMRVFWKIASAAHAANVVTLSLAGTRGERVLEVLTFNTNAEISFDTDMKAFASDSDVSVSLTTTGKGVIIAATGTDLADTYRSSGFGISTDYVGGGLGEWDDTNTSAAQYISNDFVKLANGSVDFTLPTPTALSVVGVAQTGGAETHNLTFTGTANPSERCMHMLGFKLGALL